MRPYTVAWKGSYTNVCTTERLAINPVEPRHIWVVKWPFKCNNKSLSSKTYWKIEPTYFLAMWSR